jgi:hypothetical protein
MPFYRFDSEEEELDDELDVELEEDSTPERAPWSPPDMTGADPTVQEPYWARYPKEDYSYERAGARFDPARLSGICRTVYDRLRAEGASSIRCSYDGGGDEGFTHFEHAVIGGEAVGVRELVERWSAGPLGDRNDLVVYGGAVEQPRDVNVRDVLDGFGHELASRLLGEGYGTGEYTMYGAFIADLESGEIKDLEEV